MCRMVHLEFLPDMLKPGDAALRKNTFRTNRTTFILFKEKTLKNNYKRKINYIQLCTQSKFTCISKLDLNILRASVQTEYDIEETSEASKLQRSKDC